MRIARKKWRLIPDSWRGLGFTVPSVKRIILLKTRSPSRMRNMPEIAAGNERNCSCPACGEKISLGDRFCAQCGLQLASTTTASPTGSRISTRSANRNRSRASTRGQPILAWKTRDGPDPSVQFVITKTGVRRLTGSGWRTARDLAKGLGTITALAGLASGRISYGPATLSLHHLGQSSEDRQFMRWREVRNVAVDEKKYTISLQGEGERTLDLHCTSETFVSALQLVREHVKPARS